MTDSENTTGLPESPSWTGSYVPKGVTLDEVPPAAAGLDEAARIKRDVTVAERELLSATCVPEGTFRYTPGVKTDVNFRLRRPEDWFNSELPPMKAGLTFLQEAWGYVPMDEAITMVARLGELLYGRQADGGRTVLFQAPLERWVQSEGPLHATAAFQVAYGAREPKNLLRNDGGPFGNEARLAYCNGRPFVIVVHAKRQGDSGIERHVEAVRVETLEIVDSVANEFSLPERLRVSHLLDGWGAQEEKRREVLKYADRRSVQSDADLRYLFENLGNTRALQWGRLRHAVSGMASRAIGKVTALSDGALLGPRTQQESQPSDDDPGRRTGQGGKRRPRPR